MPRGGYRPGSGRKPGTAHIKTIEIANRAAEQGLLPLEVMLDNMRFYHAEATRLVAKLIAGGMPEEHLAEGGEAKPDALKDDQPHANIIEAISQILELRKRAGEEAARTAPYVHPRMGYSARDDSDNDERMPPLAERIAYYTRCDDLKAASDKVVELKDRGDSGADPSESGPIPPPIN